MYFPRATKVDRSFTHNYDKIEFDAEDEELDKEIGMLIKNATTNSKHLTKLMDRLRFLSEEYSVNIKRIYKRKIHWI